MAGTSVLKLVVDDKQYEASLKNARQGMINLQDSLQAAGKTFSDVDGKVVEYARSIGQMETVSRTAKGRISEMSSAFIELKTQYQQMTDLEKQSPIGQAMAQSLEELKTRTVNAKQELADINKELNDTGNSSSKTGGILEQLKDKFTINIDALKLFNMGLQAANVALDVAKDAFFQSESGIDEWGRTVEGAKGAYNLFLDTLNNGNWSNFFQNLETAIKGGRELYDAFDRLGSIKSNNAAAIALAQQQIAQLRLAKQQGENVDAQLKETTARLAQLQKQSINAGKEAGNKSAFEVIRNGVNSVGGASYNDATINYVIGQIMKNGQSEFYKYKYNYETLQKKGTRTTVRELDDGIGGKVNKYIQTFDINLLTKEQQKQYSLAKAITEGETRIQQGIAAYAQAVNEGTASALEEFKGNRYALQGTRGNGGKSGGSINTDIQPIAGSLGDFNKQLSELRKEQEKVTTFEGWKEYEDKIKAVNNQVKELKGLLANVDKGNIEALRKISPASAGDLFQSYDMGKERDRLLARGSERMADLKVDNSLKEASVSEVMANISGSLQTMTSSLENLGIEIPKGLKDVLGGVQTIASLLSGIASLVSTIQILQTANLFKLAGGGVVKAANGYVPGNHYSGDMVPALLNSGELVLNQAQSNIIASALNNNKSTFGGDVQPYVDSEKIWLGLRHYLGRSGMGEIVTSKMLH